ncbi:MAG: sulfotransferase [Planctomycetota bacterium]
MPTTDLTTAFESIHQLFLQGRYNLALAQAEVVDRQRPGHVPFVGLQVACLLRMGRTAQAARLTRRTLRHVAHPSHRSMLISQLVEAHTQLNRFDDAIEIARAEHESRPDDDVVAASYIHILHLAGRRSKAIETAQAAIASRDAPSARLGASYAEAALRSDHADDAMSYLAGALAGMGGEQDESVAFAHTQLGHLLDRAKRYDEAFEQFRLSGERSPVVYNDEANRIRADRTIAAFSADRYSDRTRPEPGRPTPVFVVGMPRSGTTLTEQIIDAHPRCAGAGELHFINEIVRDLIGDSGTMDDVAPDRIDPARLAAAANSYREAIADLVHANDHAEPPEFVVDKAPGNFWYLGFIAMAFPDARVIHCRRDPRDNCLSCFFQALHAAHSYAFDLKTTGQYYRHYDRVMKHYRALAADPRAGLAMLEIEYEDTVADQEAQTRRMLDFIGVEFDEACLRFNESGRVARTLSNDQVRQPIYKTSTTRYERYADHIGPLLEGLGDVVAEYDAAHT